MRRDDPQSHACYLCTRWTGRESRRSGTSAAKLYDANNQHGNICPVNGGSQPYLPLEVRRSACSG
jgi:hypothetical protein